MRRTQFLFRGRLRRPFLAELLGLISQLRWLEDVPASFWHDKPSARKQYLEAPANALLSW